MAIFPGVPGLAGCALNSLSPFLLELCILWDRPKLSMSFLTQSHQVFFGHPLSLIPSTSHVIQRLTQSLSSFRSTCSNHLNLLFQMVWTCWMYSVVRTSINVIKYYTPEPEIRTATRFFSELTDTTPFTSTPFTWIIRSVELGSNDFLKAAESPVILTSSASAVGKHTHTHTITNGKTAQRRRKHCALVVVRRSLKFSPRRSPLPGAMGQPKFNQLEMVTTCNYRPSSVKIDAHNFELSW